MEESYKETGLLEQWCDEANNDALSLRPIHERSACRSLGVHSGLGGPALVGHAFIGALVKECGLA
jgi:hypothetical protein